jgi:hypothetical protein
MVSSDARTPEAYLAALPDDRREALSALRRVILDNLRGRSRTARRRA